MVVLYSATLFLSAFLLFSMQPMFAKMLLPSLGGTPQIWITCMVFFQLVLLAAYSYAHGLVSKLARPAQWACHFTLLLAALYFIPASFPLALHPPQDVSPVRWLLEQLCRRIAVPFFAVASTAPLLQAWFSSTAHPRAKDPYFLYVASNAGSLLALMAYPLVLERFWSLPAQSRGWAVAYLLFFAGMAACAAAGRRAVTIPAPSADSPDGRPSWKMCLQWAALAFVPSSWMLGTTLYITTDVAPIPLLWVAPLALYLGTFILAFRRPWNAGESATRRMFPLLILTLAVGIAFNDRNSLAMVLPWHLLVFFIGAWLCHRQLADGRPDPRHLTLFYFWVSVGGALGGIFNGLIAPLAFNSILEYPLALAGASLLVRPHPRGAQRPASGWNVVYVAMTVLAGLYFAHMKSAIDKGPAELAFYFALILSAILCFRLRGSRVHFTAGLAMVFLLARVADHHPVLLAKRTFFGVYQVRLNEKKGYRYLIHGTTLHSLQDLDPRKAMNPLGYYHPKGPVGTFFSSWRPRSQTPRVGVLGLGGGGLLGHAKPGQSWMFYEIDPAVADIARQTRYFTYLSRSPAPVAVRLGDGRLTLADDPPASYDLIVLDAFGSDAVPFHLLTREAFSLYRSRLTPGGVLVWHITNHYVALAPVLGDLAADAGWVAYDFLDDKTREEDVGGIKFSSEWMVMAADGGDLGDMLKDSRWKRVSGRAHQRVWSDDYSNVASAIRWR